MILRLRKTLPLDAKQSHGNAFCATLSVVELALGHPVALVRRRTLSEHLHLLWLPISPCNFTVRLRTGGIGWDCSTFTSYHVLGLLIPLSLERRGVDLERPEILFRDLCKGIPLLPARTKPHNNPLSCYCEVEVPSHLRIVIVVEMTELLRPKACALVEEAVWLRDLDHFPQELSVFLLT